MKMKSDILCLAVLCLTGCASVVETSRFALFVPPATDQAVTQKEEESNPFLRNQTNESKTSEPNKSSAENVPSSSSESSDPALAGFNFDPETTRLISERLSELPPDPKLRAERIAAWKKLSATEVKQIIRVERLAASVSQQEQSLAMANGMTGGIQTVSVQKPPEEEVRFVPNPEGGHSGLPDRSPFRTTTAGSVGNAMPGAANQFQSTLPGQNLPVTFVPSGNPQPLTPLGASLNQNQQLNPAVTSGSPPGENPFMQQTVSVPPLPRADTVVLVPQQTVNSPGPANGMVGAPAQFGGPTSMMDSQNQQMLNNPALGETPGAIPNGNDPNTGGFVRGLTTAPQSLRQFGAMLTRPFNGQTGEQATIPQFAEAQAPLNGAPPENLMGNRDALLAQLISITEQELAQLTPEQRHDYVQKNVYLRMLYLMSQQEERSLQYIPGLEPANQEFWQQLFWAMSNYFDQQAIPDAQARATQTVAQLQTASQRLQEQANLELRNVNFCQEINSFGDYKKFAEDEFTPGERVLIYAEIANFKSELTSDARYRTLLKTTIEYYRVSDNGGPVATETIQPKEDLCRNYRRDFFNGYNLHIPDNLTSGEYYMRLRLEDQLSDKFATETIKFRVP
ncbi:hypothetical protein Pla110_08580 [Polystyrenella longa]|uniref:Uncharacterized protein n=2 Tax=Polystyrenella longa TaxID=2528007 RepID=A0A518CIU9_9PLAN|nr:hypothetical protein Pla110_08580 [Polystyrenella longa]